MIAMTTPEARPHGTAARPAPEMGVPYQPTIDRGPLGRAARAVWVFTVTTAQVCLLGRDANL